MVRVMPLASALTSMRMPVSESPSDQGRGTQWSVAGEAGWKRGDGGLWSAVEGRPRAPWNSGRDRRCGWTDGLPGLGRNGPPCERSRKLERGTTFHANRQ